MAHSRFVDAFREFFSLAGPLNKVRGRSRTCQDGIDTWRRAARARLRVAEQLSPETEFAPAVVLYREGITALIGAALFAVEGTAQAADVADVRAAFVALERIWPGLRIDARLAEFRSAREALCEPAPLDELPPEQTEAAAACTAMARLVILLDRAIEPRTARQLVAYGATRKAGIVAAVCAALAIPIVSLLSPKNLALHRPVTLSSVHPSRSAVGGTYLVNGKIEYSYGVHTDNSGDGGQSDPWIMVDLQRPTHVGRIVVYNRGDTNFSDCLPLILEVGLEPSSLKVLETRDAVFTRTNPWVVDHLDETIRYVRVRKTGVAYIALDELEVYAR